MLHSHVRILYDKNNGSIQTVFCCEVEYKSTLEDNDTSRCFVLAQMNRKIYPCITTVCESVQNSRKGISLLLLFNCS